MKSFWLRALLLIVTAVWMSGCATDEMASDNAMKTGGPVPGEKTGEGGMDAMAGPGTAAAGMRW